MQDSNKLKQLVRDAVHKVHPKGSIPEWIERNLTSAKEVLTESNCRFLFYLFKKRELQEGEYWERTEDGSKILVTQDPKTSEKHVAIDYTVHDTDRVILFEVLVNVVTKEARLVSHCKLDDLKESDFEIFWV